ncbi:MAG: transglycosylase SLT domain-containing protein [Acidimicrobiales bacterium]|nr:transglycosylase SLT domain-containing protein [Acidimicrobiales bacterium]
MPRQSRPVFVAALVGIVLTVGAGAGLADSSSGSASTSYVVQPGDTLWGIASTHHLTVSQLAAYNGIDPAAILPIGRHLALSVPNTSEQGSGGHGRPVTTMSPTIVSPAAFCSSLTVTPGPWGVLPAELQASPSRLALRPVLQRWADFYGLSAPLLEAITWQESGWQQRVVSSAGAVGIGQLMPGTATFIQANLTGQPLNVASVSDNIRMAAAFLAYLAHLEGNNPCYTIAAYYEGPLNLASSGVFADTRTYVADVEALVPRFS